MMLRNLSRYIAGFVFVFSGLVKGIDPMGSMYKFMDYFTAFHLDALQPMAYSLGLILCTAEFIIGFAILTGIRMKPAAWGLLLFMAGFTPLTLYLALANPVSDCGCFGDAIHLSNWQTFYKNIVISIFALIVFVNRKKYKAIAGAPAEWTMLSIITVAFILFVQYNYRHLPLVDFRPYRTGANIPEQMYIPDDAPSDEYETTLIYEKNGKEEEFTLENYPADDTSWTFVDSRSRLVQKGYEPPIHDFSLVTPEGQDLTDIILSDESYSFLMLSIKFSEAERALIEKGIDAGRRCREEGISFYVLTSSSPAMIDEFEGELNIFYIDETTMKTIIRANPGFMVMKEGTISAKWAGRDLPPVDELTAIIRDSYPVESRSGTLRLAYIMAGILLISYISNFILRKLEKNKKT